MYCLTCFTAKKLLLPTNSRPILSGRNAVGASIVAAPIIIWGIGTTTLALFDQDYDTYKSFQVGLFTAAIPLLMIKDMIPLAF
ncbi:MAG TPA: hypothetical protein QGF02_01625 [Candidatus Babeliales bacterium]|nr:hypothetical protein [Candidatus Babeliales bacterium]